MTMTTRRLSAATLGLALTTASLTGVSVLTAEAHTVGIHDNCTNLHKKWPHGVGTRNAVDKTSGTKVRNFYKNNDAYWAAERHNATLDADNDRIACEQA